jgi:hypothetical protein
LNFPLLAGRTTSILAGRRHVSLKQPHVRILRVIALVVALPLFFSTFRFIPQLWWTLELAILMSIGAAVFSYAGRGIKRTHPFSLYTMAIAFGFPLISAIAALNEFGQPMFYGLLAQRGWLLALFTLAIGNWTANGRISLAELRSALLVLAWLNLLVCAPIIILLDPNDYSHLTGYVTNGGGVYNEFILPVIFLAIGGLYYLNKWMVIWELKYLILTLPFIVFIFSTGGRILSMGFVIASLMIAMMANRQKRVRKILANSLAFGAFLLIAANVAPEKFALTISSYQDAFAAVFGASEVDDISANARISQADMAWSYIDRNLIFGSGAISVQWQGGFERVFGYFHPSDLGVIGILFLYGFFGMLILGLQYVMFARLMPRLTQLQYHDDVKFVLIPLYAALLFALVGSISAGGFILVPEQSLLLFSIIYSHTRKNAVGRAQR